MGSQSSHTVIQPNPIQSKPTLA